MARKVYGSILSILLIPSLQATHLKHWTLKSIVQTDIFQRALPWSRLMLVREALLDDLNVGKAERMRAGLAGLLFLATAIAASGSAPWWLPAAVLTAVVAANFRLLAFFIRRRGLLFGLGAQLIEQAPVRAVGHAVDLVVAERVGEASADMVAGLDESNTGAGARRGNGGGDACGPRAVDHDIKSRLCDGGAGQRGAGQKEERPSLHFY